MYYPTVSEGGQYPIHREGVGIMEKRTEASYYLGFRVEGPSRFYPLG